MNLDPFAIPMSKLSKTLVKAGKVHVRVQGPAVQRIFEVDTLERSGRESVNPKDKFTVYCIHGGAGSNCETMSEVLMFLRCFGK